MPAILELGRFTPGTAAIGLLALFWGVVSIATSAVLKGQKRRFRDGQVVAGGLALEEVARRSRILAWSGGLMVACAVAILVLARLH